MSASLLHCLDKARVELGAVRTRVTDEIVRNEAGRLRLETARVRLEPEIRAAADGETATTAA